MATARDIITRSLREIGVVDAIEDVSAEDADASLDVLSDMVAAWELDGVPMALGTLTLNTTLSVPDSHLEAIRANLSARLGPVFGKAPAAVIMEQASRGLRALQSAYRRQRLLTVDAAIRPRGIAISRRY